MGIVTTDLAMDSLKSSWRTQRTGSLGGLWSLQWKMPARRYYRKSIQCHMRVIWDTTRRSRGYRRHSTGQTIQWRYGTLSWVVRSARQRRASTSCQLDFCSHCNFRRISGEISALDFVMGLPVSEKKNDGILTVVDRATKMVHLVPVQQTITAAETARVYWDNVGKIHGIPRSIVSDRDPRFVSKFWQEFWKILGSKLRMSSAHHPQTDGQTEAANRVVEQVLRCTIHGSQEVTHWERYLPMVEFVLNSSASPSTGYTPFYLNYGFEPTTPLDLIQDADQTKIEGVKRVRQQNEESVQDGNAEGSSGATEAETSG